VDGPDLFRSHILTLCHHIFGVLRERGMRNRCDPKVRFSIRLPFVAHQILLRFDVTMICLCRGSCKALAIWRT